MKVVLATKNPGKVRDFNHLLAGTGFEVVAVEGLPDVEETGASFIENALLKARSAARHTGLPALADDSGLEVDALGGAPGVCSARWATGASGHAQDGANNAKLVAELAGVPAPRTARFRSVVVYLEGADAEPVVGEGTVEGEIIDAPRGDGGFGYDPLFLCHELGQTFGEADLAAKGGVSHRARALAALREKLR
jgi:XTP/dITP diphosphohydrolase